MCRFLDPEEYLPINTYNFCASRLEQNNFPVDFADAVGQDIEGVATERVAYFFLREQLAAEFLHGNPYGLGLCEKPGGAFDWTAPNSQGVEFDSQGAEEIENDRELYQDWGDLIENGGEDFSDVEGYWEGHPATRHDAA